MLFKFIFMPNENNNNSNSINKVLLQNAGPNSKILKEYKNSLNSLNEMQREASIGLLLGDASIQTQNNGKTYRLKFEWGEKSKPYLDHVYTLFNEWVISPPHKKTRININNKEVTNWGFQTLSHEAFNFLSDLFLNENKKKSIKSFLIRDHLTPRGLAFWFMDDGGKLDYNKNSKNKSIVLNTQSFTESEVLNMAKELSDKFNLLCEVRSNKGKKVIVIKSLSFFKFHEIVEPFIIPEMRYKLPKP